ncbi:MAG TPA: tetratricopeptide repeat protein [Polyangia bacterium]|jgi:tetratricopeptide (TPR) repeat protein|nr:tetratricopeptide repeat protein [Polyangia bacterium]
MFFDKFRQAQSRLPTGLIRVGPPAKKSALAAADRALPSPLPEELRSFLVSFDGADLFHGSVALGGVGNDADPSLLTLNADPTVQGDDLIFAEAELGDRFALDQRGRVWRLRAGSDERVLAGSAFGKWLDAVVAREQILYDKEGEFNADAFEPDGEEVTPQTARRQAERALRQDPGSAEAHHDLGTALRRLGRHREATQALAAATALDPSNPWPWFDLGRLLLTEVQDAPAAATAFSAAAAHETGLSAARLCAWVARAAEQAGDRPQLEQARRVAMARDAGIEDDLRRAVDAAERDADAPAMDEARALLRALTGQPVPTPRRRLPVVTDKGSEHAAAPSRQPAVRSDAASKLAKTRRRKPAR